MTEESTLSVTLIAVDESVVASVKEILPIARKTLQEEGTHLPTAVLHTLEGLLPIVLPFKNEDQKRSLVDYVKEQALQRHAFAVTVITSVHIVDSRTGEDEEALVLATTVQGGQPYVLVQGFSRNDDNVVTAFREPVEGYEAVGPGQMMIYPDWEQELTH